MLIRRLKKDDVPDCLYIVQCNWGHASARLCDCELSQSFGSGIWQPVYYVAEEDGYLVGLAGYGVSWLNYGVYDISRLDVDSSYRKQGIGRALMNRCIDDIRNVGSLIMLSTTIPEYYQRFGFVSCFKHTNDTIMRLEV